MYILAITPTETYAIDTSTMTLYDPKGNFLAKGFLRIMFAMRKKDIVGIRKMDYKLIHYNRK